MSANSCSVSHLKSTVGEATAYIRPIKREFAFAFPTKEREGAVLGWAGPFLGGVVNSTKLCSVVTCVTVHVTVRIFINFGLLWS